MSKYGMRNFVEFMRAKNEGLFGLFNKRNPLYNNPEYGQVFAKLVNKHGGDEKAAEEELRSLISTPAGQYQLLRMKSTMPSSPDRPRGEEDPFMANWHARSRSSADMYK